MRSACVIAGILLAGCAVELPVPLTASSGMSGSAGSDGSRGPDGTPGSNGAPGHVELRIVD
jgi:hypothetical protein